MAEQPIDYSQVYDFLYRIERRIGNLEKDVTYIQKRINLLDSKKVESFGALGVELVELHSSLLDTKGYLGKCMHVMSMLSKDMKNAVKADDIQMLNNDLDTIQFEEYVTRKELKKGIIGGTDVRHR